MKETIFKTSHYVLEIDKVKNRAYLMIIGFWRSQEEVKDYVKDFRETVLKLKKGYTLLTDLREMKTHPKDLESVHMSAQKMLIETGLQFTAELVSSSIVQFQTDTYSKKSSMPLRQFNDSEEAERFLDELLSESLKGV